MFILHERPGRDFTGNRKPGLIVVKRPSRYFRSVIFPDWLKPESVVSR